jgi:Transcription-repair coupling factor (superfamily II helicase)
MDGIASPGIEFYLPLFFSHEAMQGQSTLISYLPKNGIVITDRRWSRV